MSFDNADHQRNDKQQEAIFSSYLGPPPDDAEEEESQFFKYVDPVAKVAFVNGIVALVLTYFRRGIGSPGIEFAIAYFLGVFLGLIFLPVLLSLILALPGLFFKRYKKVFKIIFIALWMTSILLYSVAQYLRQRDPSSFDFWR